MKKRVILASVAAALSVVAFVLIFGSGSTNSAPEPTADAGRPFITRSTTQPEKVIEGGDLRLSPGDKTFVRIYDSTTSEQKYVFRAERWEPVTDVEFHLTRPEFRVYMPDGQVTYVRSDDGQVIIAPSGRNQIDPKRGWLRGNLRITIDRTTKKWRAEHPDEAELEQHPEQTINIFLDEVSFDLDRSRLESTSDLRVQSVEADIEGKGLELAWNQVDNRVEFLTIKQGKQMELRRGGGMIDFAMPGTQRSQRDSKKRQEQKPQAPPPPPKLSTDDALAASVTPVNADPSAADAAAWLRDVAAGRTITTQPVDPNTKSLASLADEMMGEARKATDRGPGVPIAKAEPTTAPVGTKRRKIDTYSAVFTGDVIVEQRQGLRRPGRITCEKLEVVFDFGQRLKKASMQTSPKKDRPAATRPAEQPDDAPLDADDLTRLVLMWNGPLELRPLSIPADQQTGERFDCIATGREVVVDDGRGSAICKQLVYRNERQQVWLSGTDAAPVVLASTDDQPDGETDGPPRPAMAKGKLTGREVFFDRQRGIARVEGPGEMNQAKRPPSTTQAALALAGMDNGGLIRWKRGMEIELKQVQEQRPDPATGEIQTVSRDYISRAWIHGKARVERGNERIRGEEIEASFSPPARAGSSMGPMSRLHADGNVRLERKPDLIIAKKLDVDFERTPDGRDSTPKTAVAEGNVVAIQDKRRISADRVAASMARIQEPTPTSQPGARPRVQLAMTELHANGDVRAADPDQRFRVRSEELHVRIPDGRKLQAATIVGRSADRFAFVAYGDYQLAGQRIETDMSRQTADINGPGRAYFVSDRDFGGGELKKAEKTKIDWDRFMHVRGAENVAIFEGNVRSTTPTHALKCEKLTVLMAEVATPMRTESTAPIPPAERFRRKPHPVWGYYDALALVSVDLGQQAYASLRKQFAPLEPPKSPKPTANAPTAVFASAPGRTKQPVRVIASGNAVALRTVRNARHNRLLSRVQIAGNEIAVDLRRQSMNVPGKGNLLIEDYEMKSARGGRPADRPSLFSSSDGPSQTVFFWDNGMSYFGDQALVTFDRQVFMRHLSGQHIVKKEELAASMKVDPKSLRLPAGRKAELTCDNLLVQFLRTSAQQAESLDVRGADLRQLVAGGSVHLQEGTKSLMGERLTYSRETNRITVEGTRDFEARIFDQDEATQKFNMWKGPLLIWDRNGDRIEARNSQFTSRTGG